MAVGSAQVSCAITTPAKAIGVTMDYGMRSRRGRTLLQPSPAYLLDCTLPDRQIERLPPALAEHLANDALDVSSTSRQNCSMSNANPKQDRQIIGFSLPPDVARSVKAEAGRRGLSLKKLFEEMWQLYVAQKGAGGDDRK